MTEKRLLTIQDISCVGQCSLTVALPVISAMGIETAVLPTAVLSTHTAGFKDYTFRDLGDDFDAICNHWKKEKISFDTFYTGYLCGSKQIEQVENIISATRKQSSKIIIDPVMADNGVFYPGFDKSFASRMAEFCSSADVIVPNITEACFLTGSPFYEKDYDKKYIEDLLLRLSETGAKNVVLTGVSFDSDKLGIAVYDKAADEMFYYFQQRIDHNFHGTGDVYSSCLAGGITLGKDVFEAASIAVDFTVEAMKLSYENRNEHWYGVMFEKAIPFLCDRLRSSK